MKLRQMTFALALACAAGHVSAEPKWRTFQDSPRTGQWMIDVNSVKVVGDHVQFWVRMKPSPELLRQSGVGAEMAYFMSHNDAQCGGDSIVRDQFISYRKDGSVSSNSSTPTPTPAPPGSIWAGMVELACKGMGIPQ